MLKSLTTKNFRKLTDHHFDFTRGLNVIRGANEGGKTTVIEALRYSWFGVSTCRESIEEMTTWHQTGKLSVTSVFEIENVEYTVSRSAAGAECRYKDHSVVGQKEVSLFVAKLFGVSLQAIPKLMMADQGEIRGAISGGDAEATKLIETLANLKMLDELLDVLKANLPTGIDLAPQARLAAARTALAALEEPAEGVDTTAMRAKSEALLLERETALDDMKSLLAEMEPINLSIGEITVAKQKRETELARHQALQVEVDSLTEAAEAIAVPDAPSAEDVTAAQAHLDTCKSAVVISAVRSKMTALNAGITGDVWDEPYETLQAAMTAAVDAQSAAAAKIEMLRISKAVLIQQVVTSSVCGVCDLDVSGFPGVAEKNAAIAQQIKDTDTDIATSMSTANETRSELATYKTILAADQARADLAIFNTKYIRSTDTQVPRLLEWIGPDVEGSVDVPKAEAALANLNTLSQKHHAALGQVQSYKAMITAKKKALKAVDIPDAPSNVKLQEAMDRVGDLSMAYARSEGIVLLRKDEIDQLARDIATVENAAALYLSRKASFTEQEVTALQEIEDLAFNNALVKRVREVRPMVSNELWSKVLAAVSFYFSKMRGQTSVVTKGESGFQVDGHSTKGLSGSTLDALGLSIRLALTKTFAPHISMLVIDEPFAAMDEARTQACLGLIATCGFSQVILNTHEETSTSNADNLVTV